MNAAWIMACLVGGIIEMYRGVDASMKRFVKLEAENARLTKMKAGERLRADIR